MKANRGRRLGAAFLTLVSVSSLAGCVEREVAPTPRPSQPPPAPPPAPTPRPAPVDWQRAPLASGDWTLATERGQRVARFGGTILVLRCDRPAGNVVLERSGAASGMVPVTIRTSTGTFNRSAAPEAGPPPVLSVRFPVSDPALDAIAFSRGRFTLDAPGLGEIVVPSWSEIGALVENCR